MKAFSVHLAIAAPFALLWACTPDTVNHSEAVSTFGWGLVEDLRLGTVDGGGPEQFSQIAGINTDEEGRIYILDFPGQDIRVFQSDGAFSHIIGGKGEGPGEMQGAAGINFGPEGRLWTWDPRNSRYSAFEKDGTFVTSHPRIPRGVIYPWRGGFMPDGRYVDWGIERPGDSQDQIGREVLLYPIRVSADFTSTDTLPALRYEFEMTSDGRRPLPFSRGISSYQDRQGFIWFANTREYQIYRRTMEGDTTLTFSIPFEPAPVTAAELDSIGSVMAEVPAQFRIAIEEIPPTKPVVRRIFGDHDEYLYVIPELEGHPVGTVVDVFRFDGEYLGRLDFPQRIQHPLPPPHATRTHIYVVVVDDFDVEYVSRLRIVR